MNFDINIESFKICDTHLHLSDLVKKDNNIISHKNYYCCTSSFSKEQFLIDEEVIKKSKSNIVQTFGIHPQYVLQNLDDNFTFLQSLLQQKKIVAIGEIGFDFFSEEFIKTKNIQIEVFNKQLNLAKKYSVPIIIHSRKATDLLFTYAKELSKIPSVIFHSFSGTYEQAQFFLSRNINAVFSFSKQILNNNKKSIECIKKLDIRNILLETDSPYQALKFKNQDYTKMQDIINVYQKAFLLCKNESDVKNIQKNEFVNFTDIIYNNFFTYLKNH